LIGPVWLLGLCLDRSGPIGGISERNTKPTETDLYFKFPTTVDVI
jgi:hypothetical protein